VDVFIAFMKIVFCPVGTIFFIGTLDLESEKTSRDKENAMCFGDPIIHGMKYREMTLNVLDNGTGFIVEVIVNDEAYEVEIGNTQTDKPHEMIAYLRSGLSGLSFLFDDIEQGRFEGPHEARQDDLSEIWEALDGWTLEAHEDDGSYYKKELRNGTGCPVEIYLRTEEPEEWATDFSTLLFIGNKVISKPKASRTVLPKAMLEAVCFAYENQEPVMI